MKFLRHHTQHSAKYLHVIIFLTVLLNSQLAKGPWHLKISSFDLEVFEV